MTPCEVVYQSHPLPFDLYPFQVQAVDYLAPLERQGEYLDVGTGKTAVSTAVALYKKITEGRKTLVIVPPVLITQWVRWLSLIPGVTVTKYVGTPKKRRTLNLDVDFIVVGIQILKKDYDEFLTPLEGQKLMLICDEAAYLKNVGSDNHKAIAYIVKNWDAQVALLTGTPISSSLEDAYAYIKLVAPGTYRNLQHFLNVHVSLMDYFDKIIEWKNVDLLRQNMSINSVRILKQDVLPELPDVTSTPVFYELDAKHYALYKRLATEELLELETGGKIDATNTSALFHALGQVICNYDHFTGEQEYVPQAFKLVEEILEELGDGKLVVVANYKLTHRALLSRLAAYNPVAVFGDLTTRQQNENVDRFIADPSCRVMCIQPLAGGSGIDGLQHVCQDMIFLEAPTVPAHVTQVVGRLLRTGQKGNVHVRYAIATGTLQVRRFRDLMDKDRLVNNVIRNFEDLRDALFGE